MQGGILLTMFVVDVVNIKDGEVLVIDNNEVNKNNGVLKIGLKHIEYIIYYLLGHSSKVSYYL